MADPTSTHPRWLATALPALTFLLGAGIGGVLVGVGLGSDDDSSSSGSAGSSAPPSPTGSAADPGTAIIVPAACSEAADKVTEAVRLMREGAAAIGNFQPKELTRVLNELEDLDPQLQSLAKECAAVDVTTSSPES